MALTQKNRNEAAPSCGSPAIRQPSSAPALPSSILSFSGSPERLDTWMAQQSSLQLSRSRLQDLIRGGHILVNGQGRKPHSLLKPGDRISVTIPPVKKIGLEPQDIPLDVLYEDADLIVVNKPPGLVTHPAPGHEDGTLVNALLHHCRDLGGIGGELRPGIVHRLDKDTSGVLVIAKNQFSMPALVAQFKSRAVRKEYLALVWGWPQKASGTIETLIGRNPHDRKKMSAKPSHGRPAITHYEILRFYANTSLLRIRIETGRTHQIRVHMAFAGHPVVGDKQYGRAPRDVPRVEAPRQMLHAERLALKHPRTGKLLQCIAPMPLDMEEVLKTLKPCPDQS
ncbi:MAG: RluA family pseudouridine synthase [Lentisphaerota bacterium]